ncbi:hypothetical protein PYW07_003147 [Mythimna separata]|uniref:MORN repeat-containing protein 5 n=1 Tax=Mythimna separata TaxID=271217 RepID=A0AAD7YIQ2_MYTSE|nr:hypothetical protein PYW07_003147 [Mythimna separata]
MLRSTLLIEDEIIIKTHFNSNKLLYSYKMDYCQKHFPEHPVKVKNKYPCKCQGLCLMKEFVKKNQEKCNFKDLMPLSSTHIHKNFKTGSSYDGGIDVMGLSGYGEYTFPNGALYRGEFLDGMCHGAGELLYKDGPEAGCVIRGTWVKGLLTNRKIIFNGNLEYEEDNWKYCNLKADRRYAAEYETDIQPAGNSLLTSDSPPIAIPPGHYDSGEGFYRPETRVIYSYDNPDKVTRAPCHRERKWILDNCRMEPREFVGPRPDFYKTWLEPVEEPEPPPEPPVTIKSKAKTEDGIGSLFFDTPSKDTWCPGHFDKTLTMMDDKTESTNKACCDGCFEKMPSST